jgi:hypothetical protein
VFVRSFKNLEGKRLHCHAARCASKAVRSGRYCHVHRNALTRHGHVNAKTIRRIHYLAFVEPAREYLRMTKDTEATTLALEALDRALNPAYIPTSSRYYKVHEALVRLRQDTKSAGGRFYHKPITLPNLLAEAMAVHVYVARNPGLDLGPGVFWISVSRAMLRLKPRAVRNSTIDPETWKYVASYDNGLSAKMLKLLGDRLSEALRLFVVSFASVLDAQAQHEERLRLALAGHTTAEDERDAQIEDACARAAAIRKPKTVIPNANPADAVPQHFNEDERRAYLNLHRAADQRRAQEATS